MPRVSAHIRRCPKCKSHRLQPSRPQGPFESLAAIVGGTLARCYHCQLRRAWFGAVSIPIGDNRDRNPVVGVSFVVAGVAAGAAVLQKALSWATRHLG
jgi:hypothetical protein